MSEFAVGDSLPELRVTPDAGLTTRYAEASGDREQRRSDDPDDQDVRSHHGGASLKTRCRSDLSA